MIPDHCRINAANALLTNSRAPAFSRYEIYVRILVDDPAALDRRRSNVHCCAAAWMESDES
jgi:hypothetical protein